MVTTPGDYSRLEHLTSLGTGLLINITLGWKGLPRTNSLTYCELSFITDVTIFIMKAHGDRNKPKR